MCSESRKNQQGISLIEIMVGMFIGLFLLGGVIGIYTGSTQTTQMNNTLRTMQENGRFALTMLKKNIEMSGYLADTDPEKVFNPFPAAGNDELTVRFQSEVDCTGASTAGLASPNTGFAENTFKIINGELICVGNVNGADSPQIIISGVDQIRILYGLDDDDDGFANRYVKAVNVGAANWQQNVSSISVALLLNSIDNIKPNSETKSYQLLDTTTAEFSDRKTHKVFTSTILIRNRMK